MSVVTQDVFTLRRPPPQAKTSDLFVIFSLPKDYMTMIRTHFLYKKDPWWPLRFFKSIALLVSMVILISSSLLYGSGVLLERANYLGRQCFDVKGDAGMGGHDNPSAKRVYKFAMVTCQDGGNGVPGRSFEGLSELVTPNKVSYAKRHGYEFIDASHLLDRNRPPSWSKILAVRKYLADYDWVFWNDAVKNSISYSSPTVLFCFFSGICSFFDSFH